MRDRGTTPVHWHTARGYCSNQLLAEVIVLPHVFNDDVKPEEGRAHENKNNWNVVVISQAAATSGSKRGIIHHLNAANACKTLPSGAAAPVPNILMSKPRANSAAATECRSLWPGSSRLCDIIWRRMSGSARGWMAAVTQTRLRAAASCWAFAHHGDQARFFINSDFICRQQQAAVRDKHGPGRACSIVVRTIVRIRVI